MKGVVRSPSGRSARFCVKVYQAEDVSERLVEFQRCEGCTMAFNQMYKACLEAVSEHVVRKSCDTTGRADPCEGLCVDTEMTKIGLDAPSLKPCELSKETVTNLFEQAGCDFADMQREALYALANCCSTQENQAVLAQQALEKQLELLTKTMDSEDDLVRENACLCLVNWCTEDVMRSQVAKNLLSSLFSVLELPGCLENRSSKRYVAQALQLVSQSHAKDLLASENSSQYIQTLERYKNYQSDPPLANYVTATLDQITGLS